ncbi:MAG: hypothetical protein B6240_04310 [Desulfobacteraceae bacterium 4572_87]|nr:MAG: hypothetical protein B6240_04310 [Desulfobacteraceae bacterium 4572_87]
MSICLFMFALDLGPELLDLGAGKSFSQKNFHIRVQVAASRTTDHFLQFSNPVEGNTVPVSKKKEGQSRCETKSTMLYPHKSSLRICLSYLHNCGYSP